LPRVRFTGEVPSCSVMDLEPLGVSLSDIPTCTKGLSGNY